jgi:predicted nucleotidyltransferase
MNQRTAHIELDDRLLQEVVRRIRQAGNLHRIVPFGSRARGDAMADSDLDLLPGRQRLATRNWASPVTSNSCGNGLSAR